MNESTWRTIALEWRLNRGRFRIQVGLALFRLAQELRRTGGRYSPPALLVGGLYRSYSQSVLGFDIPVGVRIGPGLRVFHGFGIVINGDAVLGSGVTLRHGVTIGNRGDGAVSDAPVIGDGVIFGAGASVLGPIHVGRHALVGAHSLVTRDVPERSRVSAPRGVIRETDL